MKMPNKKFIALATTFGLSVGLLTGCAPSMSNNDENKRSGRGAVIVPPVSGSSSSKSTSSLGEVGGSKGIGGVKGGGAGS